MTVCGYNTFVDIALYHYIPFIREIDFTVNGVKLTMVFSNNYNQREVLEICMH